MLFIGGLQALQVAFLLSIGVELAEVVPLIGVSIAMFLGAYFVNDYPRQSTLWVLLAFLALDGLDWSLSATRGVGAFIWQGLVVTLLVRTIRQVNRAEEFRRELLEAE